MTQLLGLDLGTTTFKAVVYDESGGAVASARASPPGEATTIDGLRVDFWRADALWAVFTQLIRDVVSKLENPRIDALTIVEIGLVGLPLDKDGHPLHDAVTWIEPHPSLSAMYERCGVSNEEAFAITGNQLSPIYPPAWISWLRERVPEYASGMKRWVYYGDYLAYRLTGELAVDLSMASQTITLDQRTLSYSPRMLGAFGMDASMLPSPRPAGTVLGHVRGDAAASTGLQTGTPVVLGGADALAGPLGAGFVAEGDVAINTGTWECVIVCTDEPRLEPAVAEVGAICDPHVVGGRWTIRIENLIGSVTEWFRAEIVAFDSPAVARSEDAWRVLIERAEAAAPGAGGVVFYPYVFGSYGPRLDELARGAFVGLRNTTSQSDLARALFEGLNYHTRHAVESMLEATGMAPGRVVCMGGGSKNRFWMQNRADVLGRAIEVSEDADVTPRGAAMLAGVGIGVFESFEEAAARFVPRCVTIEPDPGLAERYAEIYADVFRPLGDALAPVNHAIAARTAGRGETEEPDREP